MRSAHGLSLWYLQPILVAALLLPVKHSGNAFTTHQILVERKLNFYQIEGSSSTELHKALLEKGPIDEFGKRRFAQVFWRVWWERPKLDGRLLKDQIVIRAHLELTLPQWSNSSEASSELREKWQVFYARLLQHELKHLTHLETYLPTLEKALEDEVRREGSDKDSINKVGHQILAQIRKLDQDYDQHTVHGKNEGVVL